LARRTLRFLGTARGVVEGRECVASTSHADVSSGDFFEEFDDVDDVLSGLRQEKY